MAVDKAEKKRRKLTKNLQILIFRYVDQENNERQEKYSSILALQQKNASFEGL